MLKSMTGALVAAIAFGGLAAGTTVADAMPMIDRAPAIVAQAAAAENVQEARWVCGPFRCFWRPNYYYYRRPVYHVYGWGGPRWHRPYYGWHHHWHHHWHRYW